MRGTGRTKCRCNIESTHGLIAPVPVIGPFNVFCVWKSRTNGFDLNMLVVWARSGFGVLFSESFVMVCMGLVFFSFDLPTKVGGD